MINNISYQQCKRCVMDTTDPDIIFDENGYCNNCTDFIEKRAQNKDDAKYSTINFEKLVEKIKRRGVGREYDCILGISGGVDSCYTAYILKKLNLRTLLVHMDNGWNSEEAVANIKNIATILDFDYESFVLDWEEFKDLQLSFLKASVVEADTPTDIAILGALHKIANRYNVKYIISGNNNATEGILPAHWHYDAKDMVYLNAIHKRFGTQKLKKFPQFGFIKETYYKIIRGIKIIYILNYINYSKEEAMRVLEKELNWKYYGGKHCESRYTKFVQSYLLPEKFNIDYRKATYSSQICSGVLTREQALLNLQKPIYNPVVADEEKKYVAKKLGITISELENIINKPPKTYKDYPNDEKRLQLIYNIYRKLFN